MFDSKPYQSRFDEALNHFKDELAKIRVGRAHPEMLATITVEAYGQAMPLNQVGNVTAIDAQMLQVTPFDPANLQTIAAAIRQDQSLGLNPSDDGRVVRVPIPAPTEERRQQTVKQVGGKAEESKIAIRNIRQDALKDIKARKDAKELSEDDARRAEKDIDNLVADVGKKVDEAASAKEKDILTI